MFRGMGSDFEMIEGEGILRVRNKKHAKRGKNQNLGCKENKENRDK